MKKRIVSILLSSVLVVSSMTACTGGETGTGSTTVEVKDEEGNTQQIEVKDTATGEVKVDDKGDVSYEVKDLYIVVDGTLTATADNGQAEFGDAKGSKDKADIIGHLGMRKETTHHTQHCETDTRLAVTVVDEIESAQGQRHQSQRRGLAMMIGTDDDEEIT